MSQQKESKHIEYFDLLRAVSMFGVVFMHLASAYLSKPDNTGWKILVIPTSFFFIAVPVFFMISGALLLSSPSTSDPSALTRRVIHLAVPLFIWSAGVLILDDLSGLLHTGRFDLMSYLQELLSVFFHEAAPPYWFLYYLIPLYLLSPVLKAAAEGLTDKSWRYIEGLAVIVTVYETAAAAFPSFSAQRMEIADRLFMMSGCLAYFFLGYRLHTAHICVKNTVLAAVIIIDTVLISILTIIASKASFDQTYQRYDLLFIMILAVSVFLFCRQNTGRLTAGVRKICKRLAELSFGVYLSHVPVILILPSIGIDISKAGGMLISFIAVPAICIILTDILSRIPILGYFLTGIRRKR